MVQGLDEVGPKKFFLGSVKRVLHVMSSHMFAPQWPQFDGTSSFPKSPLRAKARSSAKSVAPGWLDRPLVTQSSERAFRTSSKRHASSLQNEQRVFQTPEKKGQRCKEKKRKGTERKGQKRREENKKQRRKELYNQKITRKQTKEKQ